jgi:eukaryotic-like serine/threonine-protein kinase
MIRATATAPRVDIDTLGRLGVIGAGGQGIVYRVTCPGRPAPVAFKRYRSEVLHQVDWSALDELIGTRDEVRPDVRAWLDERAAWPQAVVTRADQPCGYLMPEAPPEFTVDLYIGRHLCALEFLLNPADYLGRIGLRVSRAQALSLLRELVVTLDRLHSLGITVGDLSPKNVAIAVTPEPRCFLLDCDGFRHHGRSALAPVETPEWWVPAGEAPGTAMSDIYKLGLVAIRLWTGDQSTRDISGVRPRPLAAIAKRSLALDPAARPTARAWVTVLDRVVASPGAVADRSGSTDTGPSVLRHVAMVAAVLLALFCAAVCLGVVAPWGAG